MTRREGLRRINELAELRSKKLNEIREFLSVSPETDDRAVLGIIKWWQKTAACEPSFPPELKADANRLFDEFHSIEDANRQIPDKLEDLGKRGHAVA
jgi:hypothetical protein